LGFAVVVGGAVPRAGLGVGALVGAEVAGARDGLTVAGLLAGVACFGGDEAFGLATGAVELVATAWLEAGVAAA
jgi:hypothetical protein